MSRRRKGLPISGWLIIDKPSGMTSTAVVNDVRRRSGAAKVGHAGTLDPLATGVLPIALGEATKTVPYIVGARKRYRFTVRWGESRDTDDADGVVTETSDVRPEPADIEAALVAFVGTIAQVPPAYSAIKVGGERAYALARENAAPELEAREVTVYDFRRTGDVAAAETAFEVECGKGTYMRALARDLARALGTVGHVGQLRRLSVGRFHEDDAISLESVDALRHSPGASEHLLPVAVALDDIPALTLTGSEANRLKSGQAVAMFRASDLGRLGDLREGDTVCAMAAGKPVALARIDKGMVCPVRVLNL